jgi:hypothetical protein
MFGPDGFSFVSFVSSVVASVDFAALFADRVDN